MRFPIVLANKICRPVVSTQIQYDNGKVQALFSDQFRIFESEDGMTVMSEIQIDSVARISFDDAADDDAMKPVSPSTGGNNDDLNSSMTGNKQLHEMWEDPLSSKWEYSSWNSEDNSNIKKISPPQLGAAKKRDATNKPLPTKKFSKKTPPPLPKAPPIPSVPKDDDDIKPPEAVATMTMKLQRPHQADHVPSTSGCKAPLAEPNISIGDTVRYNESPHHQGGLESRGKITNKFQNPDGVVCYSVSFLCEMRSANILCHVTSTFAVGFLGPILSTFEEVVSIASTLTFCTNLAFWGVLCRLSVAMESSSASFVQVSFTSAETATFMTFPQVLM